MTTTQNEPITIFSAKKIITMNDAQPEATHVAVQGGRILAVGNEEEVRSWCKDEVAIDDRYADQILMPGLIEGHSHLHEGVVWRDRKSTRLNSSHVAISYAVFCLEKK